MKELEVLKNMIENRIKYAEKFEDRTSREHMFHQAYGAADLFATLHPELASELDNLWENQWKPAFDELLAWWACC